jgi:hypothetical protein
MIIADLRHFAACALACSTVAACGTNNADVPPELLDAIKHPNAQGGAQGVLGDAGDAALAPSYPAGPYGTQVGTTVQNLCFDGWTNPKASNFDPKAFHRVCFGDYYDPSGAKTKLLLVESCAVWCVACRGEYGGSGNRLSLSAQLTKRAAQGFQVMGTIFQNSSADPAAPSDAVSWARTYDLAFPFVLDQGHQLGLFSPPTVAPFNMLVDTRTMKIVLELQGDEPATLFQAVDDFLAKTASP